LISLIIDLSGVDPIVVGSPGSIGVEIDFDLGGQPLESIDDKRGDLRRMCASLTVPETRGVPSGPDP
jgi:hypothetical protein